MNPLIGFGRRAMAKFTAKRSTTIFLNQPNAFGGKHDA